MIKEKLCVDEQILSKDIHLSSLMSWVVKYLIRQIVWVYEIMPYTSKIEPVHKPNVSDFKPNSNSVLHLAESIPCMKNYKLYFDNWFTFLSLFSI